MVITGTSEAELVRVLYTEQGVDMKRVTLDYQLRTIRENALRVAEPLAERCLMTWQIALHELLGLVVYGQDDEPYATHKYMYLM